MEQCISFFALLFLFLELFVISLVIENKNHEETRISGLRIHGILCRRTYDR
jgi:hypothetical protein